MSEQESPSIDPELGPSEFAEIVDSGDPGRAAEALEAAGSAGAVRLASRLSEQRRAALLAMLDPEEAASLLRQLPEPQIYGAVERLEPGVAAGIVAELPSDAQADVIGEVGEDVAGEILGRLDAPEAADARRLSSYEDGVAGGLMITEYLSYGSGETIAQVIQDLGANAKEYADYDIQYGYVTDGRGGLIGVLRMRDLLLSRRSATLREIMIENPKAVRDEETLESLVRFFDEHKFFGVPVIDATGRLCGVVQRSAVEQAVADGNEDLYRKAQGIVGGEELRSMPLLLRARRRLSWLSINIVLNIIAASVIALHQETLEAVIALAVFLPIISDMSGCSGNQAVAVSMRELTLGVIRPTEVLRTVLAEAAVGVVNGLVLGALIGTLAWGWKGNGYLGMVVGGALMANTIVAVVIGGSVPLLLKRRRVDPALAAGPILTTITDMCGFFIILSLASALLSRLT